MKNVNLKALAAEIENNFFEMFEIRQTKAETASDIWYNHLTPAQRLEIMNKFDNQKNALAHLRACLDWIAKNI